MASLEVQKPVAAGEQHALVGGNPRLGENVWDSDKVNKKTRVVEKKVRWLSTGEFDQSDSPVSIKNEGCSA
jgi:hypothetical protein